MRVTQPAAKSPDNLARATPRFLCELAAWVATPWAFVTQMHSVALAVMSVIVLIGLPAAFATPAEKPKAIVPIPGSGTVALVALQLFAALISAWLAWPMPAAIVVSALIAVTVVTEQPRWRWLFTLGSDRVE